MVRTRPVNRINSWPSEIEDDEEISHITKDQGISSPAGLEVACPVKVEGRVVAEIPLFVKWHEW